MAEVARIELSPEALLAALREQFGFDAFLPGQGEVVQAVLRGDDQLVVRPTGSGKSLCFQLPALLLPPLTVVISPLIALMKDQVDALDVRHPGRATFINSSIPLDEQRRRLNEAVEGRVKLLYVAPERFRYAGFVRRLGETRVQRFVVDEAHCISQWGHDFRPDYMLLGEAIEALGGPPLLAATATATVDAQTDICRQLGRPDMARAVSGFNRPNLTFEVRSVPAEPLKLEMLERLLGEQHGSGIVYAGTRKAAEEVAGFVDSRTHRPTVVYHAGLTSEERHAAQELFMAEPEAIAVATNAFGMGIDKPEVRFVVHYALPGTIEAYYQEAGRAGRDGQNARCVLLYDPSDAGLQSWFIDREILERGQLLQAVGALHAGCRDAAQLAERCAVTDNQARVLLSYLERIGLVTDLGSGEDLDRYQVRRRGLQSDEIAAFEEQQQWRRRLREHQLAAMVRYAEMDAPRRTFLLGYFGDPTHATPQELEADDPAPTADDGVTEAESDGARRILETVAAARFPVGRAKLVQILAGARGKTLDEHLRGLPTYGSLGRVAREALGTAIDHLVLGGWLKSVGCRVNNRVLAVIALSRHGRAALAAPDMLVPAPALRPATRTAKPSAAPAPSTTPQPVGMSAEEAELFERLRVWRRERAREEAVAPYVICHDSMLRTVCRHRPTDLAALGALAGFGDKRAARCDGLTEVVSAWLAECAGGETPAVPAPAPKPTPPPMADEPDPVRRAVAMLADGRPLEAAARAVGVPVTTLAGRVETLIRDGALRPADVLGATEAARIAAALADDAHLPLPVLRAALGDGVSPAAMRWVRASLGREPSEPAAPALDAVSGPWTRGWRVSAGAVIEDLIPVLGAQTVALAVPLCADADVERLLVALSRRLGWPVIFCGADDAARLKTPLLLAGPDEAVREACARLRPLLNGPLLALLTAPAVNTGSARGG